MIGAASHPVGPAGATKPEAQAGAQRKELREAAEAFEAIMLRQLMATARAANFGGESALAGDGAGGGLKQFEAMRDEHFAEIASKSGAFGFAATIEQQLSAHLARTEA